MNIFLTWKKGFFSSTYQIHLNSIQIGFLKLNTWSQKAKSVLKDQEFDIITKGFFSSETTFTDLKTNQQLVKISYNNWKSKATIKLSSGEEYQWQYNNFWHTKWQLTNNNIFINYKGSTTKGEISSTTDSELLIIAGLYISHYFFQRKAGAIAVT